MDAGTAIRVVIAQTKGKKDNCYFTLGQLCLLILLLWQTQLGCSIFKSDEYDLKSNWPGQVLLLELRSS